MSMKTISLRLNQTNLEDLHRLSLHYKIEDNPSVVLKVVLRTHLDYIFKSIQQERQLDIQFGKIQELRRQIDETLSNEQKNKSEELYPRGGEDKQTEHSSAGNARRLAFINDLLPQN